MVDLMSEVALREDVNKMSTKNCAIVMGPNLYQYDDRSASTDPMQALVVSNKCCSILSNLIIHNLQVKHNWSPKGL